MSHSPTRRILIQKGPNGLGFSVKGGGDVGIPLIVSRVEAGGGAVGLLKVGMEISAVNGISLEGLPHYAAVEVLRRTRSPVILFVRNSTSETVAIVENCLPGRGTKHNGGFADYSGTLRTAGTLRNSGTLRSTNSRSEYDTEYKLYYGTNLEEADMNPSRLPNFDSSNVDLYDLRTVKRFVKEILHQPKEIFAKKLAWQFPPIALGKFHKWLLTKLQRFDCEAPANTANYIFDAFSQSLYLSRAIYDLVHLIRTLIAMERTAKSDLVVEPVGNMARAVQPACSAEFNNPQVMASFLSELTEIRAQLARAKEQEARSPVVDTQAHIYQQDAEIRALREQLMNYEARIAALTTNNSSTIHKETDLGSFFKEGFKKIKNKTLKRRHSLSQNRGSDKLCTKPSSVYQPGEKEKAKENCPNNAAVKPPLTRDNDVTVSRNDVTVSCNDVTVSRNKPLTSTPTPCRDTTLLDVADSHNEICIQMGEEVQAHTLQVRSDEELIPPRDRIYSSDDDYVQMNGVPSPIGTLPRICPLEEEVVIRRTSRDFKRSSVSSSQSKASTESIKLKRKQTIMIDSTGDLQNESSDYIHMSNPPSESETDYVQPETETDYVQHELDTDYVQSDARSCSYLTNKDIASLFAEKHASVSSNSTEVPEEQAEITFADDEKNSVEEEKTFAEEEKKCVEEEKEMKCVEEEEMKSQEEDRVEDPIGSDTISTSTVKAEVNVADERQINAVQVREISRDVDSIMVDVETLHRIEQSLKKPAKPPALFPKPALFKNDVSAITNNVSRADGMMTSPGGGGMIKAHEVPIYAKVDRIMSPPPPRIRPFSFGETSNCSFTSQNELSRHDVCSKTSVRKTSLTSNGSSIELKSEYSYDRPSSYNTSHTTSTEHGDRFSRVSSDIIADEDHRLSVLSDNKSDSVFSPIKFPHDPLLASEPFPVTPVRAPGNAPEKPPRSSPPLHSTPERAPDPDPRIAQINNTPETLNRNVSFTEPRNRSANPPLNVSFDEDCLHKEVGQDFFNRGGKEKKRTPFKKMLSFGKGKKKRSLPTTEKTCTTLPRQPDILQPRLSNKERRASSEEFQHSRHFSVHRGGRDQRSGSLSSPQRPGSLSSPIRTGSLSLPQRLGSLSSPLCNDRRSRDNSGASSSTGYSAHSGRSTNSSGHSGDGNFVDSTRNSGVSSVHSGELIISPISVSPIGELDREMDVGETHPPGRIVSQNLVSDANKLIDSNKISTIDDEKYNSLFDPVPRKTSKGGFYEDLGIKINFDDIPVKSEAILDLTNETIIDLDGDIIKDPDELRVLRGANDRHRGANDRHPDSRLSAKVDKELRINSDCNKMVSEIERLSSPSLVRVKREETPSPSFSEIDILLGNISKDLDNFNI